MTNEDYRLQVEVQTQYLAEESDADSARYVFGYKIQISNISNITVKLLRRHWYISNANGEQEEVEGEGVVGEQPVLAPGESFEYSSGCVLATPFGSMRGSYLMQAEDGTEFSAEIPEFFLIGPRTLH